MESLITTGSGAARVLPGRSGKSGAVSVSMNGHVFHTRRVKVVPRLKKLEHLEVQFLLLTRRTSDFGVLNIITNIFKTTQNLRFWSFCGGRKTSVFGVFAYSA